MCTSVREISCIGKISVQKQNTGTKTELYEHVGKYLKIKFTEEWAHVFPTSLWNVKQIRGK
jgi:hypothetical protein